MADARNQKADRENSNNQNVEQKRNKNSDLKDSPRDEERLRGEEGTINMPEVKDIPGQELVNTPPATFGDTTIASADEEGTSVFDRTDEEDLRRTGDEADVSRNERKPLEEIDYMTTTDEDNL